MTPTQDMIERVARVIYEIEPIYGSFSRPVGETGTTTDQIRVSWEEALADSADDWVCRAYVERCRKQARAAIEAMGELHSQATPPDLTSTVPEAPDPFSKVAKLDQSAAYVGPGAKA